MQDLTFRVLEKTMIKEREKINRGSYMSAHDLLNLLNELGKRDKMQGLSNILSLFHNGLINSIISEHKC